MLLLSYCVVIAVFLTVVYIRSFPRNKKYTERVMAQYDRYDKDVAKRDERAAETNDFLKSILAELRKLNAEKS